MREATRDSIASDPFFADFVRLAEQRFGYKRRTVEEASKDAEFVAWYRDYLANGCGVKG